MIFGGYIAQSSRGLKTYPVKNVKSEIKESSRSGEGSTIIRDRSSIWTKEGLRLHEGHSQRGGDSKRIENPASLAGWVKN